MYEYTDKVISSINRRFIREFRKLRILKFDEMNVLNSVVSVYKRADNFAMKGYLDIAKHAYQRALKEAQKTGFKQRKKTEFDVGWLLLFLEKEDPVTLYDYSMEWERKRQRLSEALAASNMPLKELDKALRLMTLQTNHYADKATVEATLQGYKDAGVKAVRWVTEKDEKVCPTCKPRDGRIYDIDKVPQIPAHFRCRCRLVPVKKTPKRMTV